MQNVYKYIEKQTYEPNMRIFQYTVYLHQRTIKGVLRTRSARCFCYA